MYVFCLFSVYPAVNRQGWDRYSRGRNFLQPQHHTRFVRKSVDILLSKTRLYPYTVCDNGIVQRSASFFSPSFRTKYINTSFQITERTKNIFWNSVDIKSVHSTRVTNKCLTVVSSFHKYFGFWRHSVVRRWRKFYNNVHGKIYSLQNIKFL